MTTAGRSVPALLLRLLPYAVLVIPLLLYLPGIAGFPYSSPKAEFSDLAISHYPYALFIQRSLVENGRIPLWYPSILSGMPLAGNPLAGLWYPPGWLALLLPLPFGLNLLAFVHLLWGGVGTYRLLRSEGLGQAAALWGGAAVTALPKLAAHFGAGHLTLIYAVSWTPWLLLAARSSIVSPVASTFVSKNLLKSLSCNLPVREAICLALTFLADPRWAPVAGSAWLGYRLVLAFGTRRTGLPPGSKNTTSRWSGRVATAVLPVIVLGGLLAAPLALPMLELVLHTTRTGLVAADQFTYSLPPGRLLGLFYPDFGGFHEYILYPGQAVLFLALAALAIPRRSNRLFWTLAAGAGLLLAMGEHLPGLMWLGQLPGFNLLRVPSRFLFLSGLAIAALSAYGLDGFLSNRTIRRWARLALVGVAGFSLLLAAGISMMGPVQPSFLWGSMMALVAVAILLIGPGGGDKAGLQGKKRSAIWLVMLFAIGILDWMVVDRSLFAYRPTRDVLAENQILAQGLAEQRVAGDLFRVYSPSYSLPQQTAASLDLELADGVDPLQLASYVRFMQPATGIPTTGYSVTLPPMAGAAPAEANAEYVPDAGRLGWLNVRYVAAEFDLDAPGLEFDRQVGNTRLYRNQLALPRAWAQPESATLGEQTWPVEIMKWEPDHVDVQAQGPGVLVLSELAYPGWQARLDGRPVSVETKGDLFRSVRLPDGRHEVTLVYRPLSVVAGLLMAAIGWIFLLNRSMREPRVEDCNDE